MDITRANVQKHGACLLLFLMAWFSERNPGRSSSPNQRLVRLMQGQPPAAEGTSFESTAQIETHFTWAVFPIISNILHQTKQFIIGLQEDYWNASYKNSTKQISTQRQPARRQKISGKTPSGLSVHSQLFFSSHCYILTNITTSIHTHIGF